MQNIFEIVGAVGFFLSVIWMMLPAPLKCNSCRHCGKRVWWWSRSYQGMPLAGSTYILLDLHSTCQKILRAELRKES